MTSRGFPRTIIKLLPFALFAGLALCISPFVGSVAIDPEKALSHWQNISNNLDANILFAMRLPRTLLAALTGGGLAIAGAAFQALLRNPLATPYTLGVSSGGSLGAVLAIKLGLDISLFGISTTAAFAFLGALGTVFLVYSLARTRNQLPTHILLLAGISLSFFFSAMILFVHYAADFAESYRMVRWLMGGLDILGFDAVWGVLPFWLLGGGVLLLKSSDLNQLSFGSYMAHVRGVDVVKSPRMIYGASSLIVAAVVSVAGPIGFVGLIVPHTVRFLIGPDHRILMPACLLAGAGFLVICDTVARTIFAPTELPVGILTALIGGPFFIGLLFREKRKYHS